VFNDLTRKILSTR